MKRQYLLTAAGLALVAVALVLSCGGNDNGGTNPYSKIAGDTTDVIYRTARAEVATSVGYSQGMLKDIFTMLGQISPDVFTASRQNVASQVDSGAADTLPVYDSVGQYWIRTILDTLQSSDRAYASYIDSVQFLESTGPVKYPDSTKLTSIKVGSRWRLSYADKVDSQAISLNAVITGQPHALTHRGDAIINGSGFFAGCVTKSTVSGPDTACSFIYAFSMKHENVHVNIGSVFYGRGCPTSGLAKHTGVMINDCHAPSDSLDYEKQWTAVTTYDGLHLKFTIENPSTRWIFETSCGYIAAPPQPQADIVAEKSSSRGDW